jgi:hypothetical protein
MLHPVVHFDLRAQNNDPVPGSCHLAVRLYRQPIFLTHENASGVGWGAEEGRHLRTYTLRT